MLACAAPEILIAAIAAATTRIRVGSGGVMLPHYSAFKVAETFSVLGGLHGKRIDLGIGRAPGSDLETIAALQRDRRQPLPDDFPEQVDELLAYFEDSFPPGASVRPARAPARRAGHGRGLAARIVLPERDLGGGARPALFGRRLHQPRERAGRVALPRAVHAGPATEATAGLGRGRRRLRRDRRRGRAARLELAHGDHARRTGAVRPAADSDESVGVSRGASGRRYVRRAGASSSDRPTLSGRRSSRSWPTTAPTS